MKFSQTAQIPVAREPLWNFLMDVPKVAKSLPGVESVSKIDDTTYQGTLTVRVGPIKLNLQGKIILEEQNKEASVNVTATGFEPQSLTVSVDTNVVWTNSSGEVTNVSSDNHPTHLRFPFLNLGNFDNGTTVSVVFDKAGTYAYHNHLHPEQTGTVMVK